jgi:drug/metabolite transporter (DMT)-like permease
MLWIALAGAGFATAFASFYTALSRIDFSVGAPILGAVPMVSYVVILFVLRGEEHITPRALLGATLVVVGVGIIGVTN